METEFEINGGTTVYVYPSQRSVEDILQSKVEATDRSDHEDPFFVVNLGRLAALYNQWNELLPSVTPFYAVKCNYDPVLLQTLAALGTGFDCASKQEIETILNLGVDPSRIIYANPCKQNSHIRFAAKVGVKMMTFDNEVELHKIKHCFPSAELVIRIIADDPTATCNLGQKFGVRADNAHHLLSVAKDLNLNIIGVSFHVGSGAQSSTAYANALSLAKDVFVAAERLGFTMKLLDIGGGFPGSSDSSAFFQEITQTINASLASLFGQYKELKVIAEPGRYFACSTHVLAVNVISKRCVTTDNEKEFIYYISDGIYGSFNCLLHGHVKPTPNILQCSTNSVAAASSVIWGPTCDSIDKVNSNFPMPELNVGDWLYYVDMGAYTVCAQSPFNGFTRPKAYFYCTDKESKVLRNLLSPSSAKESTTIRPPSCQQSTHEQSNTGHATVKMEIDCC